MNNSFKAGILMLVVIWLLVQLNEVLPFLEPWIYFGALAGVAMSLGSGRSATGGSP